MHTNVHKYVLYLEADTDGQPVMYYWQMSK